MQVLAVSPLPDTPSAAAAAFHADWLPQARALLNPLPFRGGGGGEGCRHPLSRPDNPHPNPSPEGEGLLVLTFDAADYTHTGWRLAAVQMLAREHAPARVNAISGGGAAARAAALAYLADGAGITGQYLPLDDAGAGSVVVVPV